MNFKSISSTVLILLFAFPFKGEAQTDVSVIKGEANIYEKPGANSPVHLIAQEADIFEAYKVQGDWLQVNLFSGAKGYLKSSQVKVIDSIPSYPSDPKTRDKLCMEAKKARNKASQKSMSDYPDNIDRQAAYEKALFDKYLLESFRNFEVPASHYSKLVECVDDGIFQIFEIDS